MSLLNTTFRHSSEKAGYSNLRRRRRLYIKMRLGAQLHPSGVHFRVWAPDRKRVEVRVEGRADTFALDREKDGYFSGVGHGVLAGAALYG